MSKSQNQSNSALLQDLEDLLYHLTGLLKMTKEFPHQIELEILGVL